VTRVRLRGAGRVELAAYGLADAEHRVEKELRAAWPGCAVEVLEVTRPRGAARIVEEFAVRYRVRGAEEVGAGTGAEQRAAALRVVRARFAGSRFERIDLGVDEGSAGT
jgi:hypothetical protein